MNVDVIANNSTDMMNPTSTPTTTDHRRQENVNTKTNTNDDDEDEDDGRAHTTAEKSTAVSTTVVLFYKYFLPSLSRPSKEEYPFSNSNNSSNRDDSYYFIQNYSDYYLDRLRQHIQHLCSICHIPKGRILIATEGINGTISATHPKHIQQFIKYMETLDIVQQFGLPPNYHHISHNNIHPTQPKEFLFQNIDWKISTTSTNPHSTSTMIDPFPDLKISIVSEIISTGNHPTTSASTKDEKLNSTATSGITLHDMVQYGGGIHLSPTEFHTMIEQDRDNVILFDIRNTFEYQIGHFVHPHTQQSAIHPKDMVQFSTLPSILQQTIFQKSSGDKSHEDEPNAVDKNDSNSETKEQQLHDELQNKKILLYCTGGIRCEKASVMFQKFLSNTKSASSDSNTANKGNSHHTNVYQLSGGIHRYIEQYGSNGYFKGKNFVFDQRIVQHPSDYDTNTELDLGTAVTTNDENAEDNDPNIVGQCVECGQKYDVLCGSRICTVCRDLVLVCTGCQTKLREYHCSRHQIYKTCYYTFLDVFTKDELRQQYNELTQLRDGYLLPQQPKLNKEQLSKKYRNVRRTLHKQMMKVQGRIHDLENGIVQCDRNAARRCRTCFEPDTICDGKCWGFWKRSLTNEEVEENIIMEQMLPMLTIGAIVEPGPHWNESRFGSKYECLDDPKTLMGDTTLQPQQLRRGYVVDVKTWGSNSTEYDCVAVSWFTPSSSSLRSSAGHNQTKIAPLIYRWGVIARNGQRMYDLQRVESQ